jgi:hypothetical protein
MMIDPAGVSGGGLRYLLEAETHVEVVTEIPADADAMSPFASGPGDLLGGRSGHPWPDRRRGQVYLGPRAGRYREDAEDMR